MSSKVPTSKVSRFLTDAIVQGRIIPPGETFSERQLVNRYGFSRAQVRDILLKLETRGGLLDPHGSKKGRVATRLCHTQSKTFLALLEVVVNRRYFLGSEVSAQMRERTEQIIQYLRSLVEKAQPIKHLLDSGGGLTRERVKELRKQKLSAFDAEQIEIKAQVDAVFDEFMRAYQLVYVSVLNECDCIVRRKFLESALISLRRFRYAAYDAGVLPVLELMTDLIESLESHLDGDQVSQHVYMDKVLDGIRERCVRLYSQDTVIERKPYVEGKDEKAFAQLLELYMSGIWSVGESIRESTLMTQFEISRFPMRNTLFRMDGYGFVTLLGRQGTVVNGSNGQALDYEELLKIVVASQVGFTETELVSKARELQEAIHDVSGYYQGGEIGQDYVRKRIAQSVASYFIVMIRQGRLKLFSDSVLLVWADGIRVALEGATTASKVFEVLGATEKMFKGLAEVSPRNMLALYKLV
ncbi:hypothetical protein A6E01_19325 (plasmid) [Vibrio breoganii]|uniref:HTH gntR-type domain-containing protein n=1 Tax=Vibrio breoganii TaxID=553239 RepID=A0AAN0XZ22_9VIBR|nr:GntR family transcriptional regulator [Vibrio breoganii]ANO35367.1 hypothetical protein A6E01_19325 [Vibrio breoganii]